MYAVAGTDRASTLRLGRRLELLTIAWAGTEAALGLLGAWRGRSISLAAFGFDSVIEVASAGALLWRLRMDDPRQRVRAERMSLRFAAVCLLLLATYVAVEAVLELRIGASAAFNLLGIVVTASAVVLMPLLGRAKRVVGRRLNSTAVIIDSRQADFCALQALIVLLGLLVAHWWHVPAADGVAALLLAPLIVREAVRALQGESCGCSATCA